MSNFEKVVDFNKSFGVTVHDTIQKNIYTEDPALVELRLKLIVEEVDELKDSIKNHIFLRKDYCSKWQCSRLI